MCNVIQYPDLTEVTPLYSVDRYVETEFSFGVSANYQTDSSFRMLAYGYRPVSRMNNWYPTHKGEYRHLTLWWKRIIKGGLSKYPVRTIWDYERRHNHYPTFGKYLASGGCGFLIGEPPLRKNVFFQYFTLLRMPVRLLPIQERWLLRHNFRLLDTGSIASYWVNGWEPDKYDFETVEEPYFKSFFAKRKDPCIEIAPY